MSSSKNLSMADTQEVCCIEKTETDIQVPKELIAEYDVRDRIQYYLLAGALLFGAILYAQKNYKPVARKLEQLTDYRLLEPQDSALPIKEWNTIKIGEIEYPYIIQNTRNTTVQHEGTKHIFRTYVIQFDRKPISGLLVNSLMPDLTKKVLAFDATYYPNQPTTRHNDSRFNYDDHLLQSIEFTAVTQ